MAPELTRAAPISPTSSIASLPASDDVSDFSDSDFDIISSSGSARSSHEDEDILHALGATRGAVSATASDNGFSDDEEAYTTEPDLLLDQDWLGLTGSRGRSAPLPRISPDATAAADPLALSDEDLSVIDALSHPLERSDDSIRASTTTPINASVHFVTSPNSSIVRGLSGLNRRRDSMSLSRRLSASQRDSTILTDSPSSEVLQLAFPDPLSTSEATLPIADLPASPIGDDGKPDMAPEPAHMPIPVVPDHDHADHESDLPIASGTGTHAAPEESAELIADPEAETPAGSTSTTIDDASTLVNSPSDELFSSSDSLVHIERPAASVPAFRAPAKWESFDTSNYASFASYAHDEEKVDVEEEDEKAFEIAPRTAGGVAQYRPFFDAFDDYLALIVRHLSDTIAGNRWTASVILSVLALIIGGITYVGAPSTPLPTPSLLVPSSTSASLWGILYPMNKSSIIPLSPPSPVGSQTSTSELGSESPLSPSSVGLKDMSLSLFAPWALSVTPSPAEPAGTAFERPRGIKRKRSRPSAEPSSSEERATKDEAPKMCDDEKAGEEASKPTLMIDAPRSTRGRPSSSTPVDKEHALSLPAAPQDVLSQAFRTSLAIIYDALSSDLATLQRALDEFLAVIARVRASSSTSFASGSKEVFVKTMKARHARARKNAKKSAEVLKRSGGEVLESLGAATKRGKETLGAATKRGRSRAKAQAGVIKDLARGVKENVKEGIRVRKSRSLEFGVNGAFGSSGGERSGKGREQTQGLFGVGRKHRQLEKERTAAKLAEVQGKKKMKSGTGFLAQRQWARERSTAAESSPSDAPRRKVFASAPPP